MGGFLTDAEQEKVQSGAMSSETARKLLDERDNAATVAEGLARWKKTAYGDFSMLGQAIGQQHPVHIGEIVSATAIAVLVRTYDRLCDEVTRFGAHPGHDGRLSCGQVVGALATLGTVPGDDPMEAARFWLKRVAIQPY